MIEDFLTKSLCSHEMKYFLTLPKLALSVVTVSITNHEFSRFMGEQQERDCTGINLLLLS